jgi:transcriptional regulator with GAF, ATPase, and Fis domain
MPERAAADFEALFEHCAAITASLELDEVVNATLASTKQLLVCDQVVLSLLEDDMIKVLAADPPVSAEIKERGLPAGSGLVGRAVAERAPVYAADLTKDPRAEATRHRWGSNDRSVIAVPLALGTQIVGTLHAISTDVDAFSEQDRARLLALAPAVATAMRNALVLERERESWNHHRRLDEQKTAFMQLAVRGLEDPLAEIETLVHRLNAAEEEEVTHVAELLLDRSHHLVRQIEQVLDLSLKDSSEIVLPTG